MARKPLLDINNSQPNFFAVELMEEFPDRAPWIYANNWVESQQGFTMVRGTRQISGSFAVTLAALGTGDGESAGAPVRAVYVHRVKAQDRIIFALGGNATTSLYARSGAAGLQIISSSLATGQRYSNSAGHASMWSFTGFGDWVIAAEGSQRPLLRTGCANFRFLTGTTGVFSAAHIVRTLANHVLAFRTTGKSDFHWCDTDNPQSWTAEVANAAGSLTIREMNSHIRCAERLGNDMAVYSDRDQYLVYYQGSPFYFGYRRGSQGAGAWGKNSVVSLGNLHYGWGPEGIWMSDGITTRKLTAGRADKFIRNYLNEDEARTIHGMHDERNHQVIWWFPCLRPEDFGKTSADIRYCSVALAYNYDTGEFSTFSLPGKNRYVLASVNREALSHPLIVETRRTAFGADGVSVSTEQTLFHYWGGHNILQEGGTTRVAQLTSRWFDLGDPMSQKEIHEARLTFGSLNRTSSLHFILETSQGDISAGVNAVTKAVSVVNQRGRVELMGSGRLFRFTLRNAITSDFRFTGIQLFGRIGGFD